MWILNYVTKNSAPNAEAEQGNVKGALNGRVQINASSDFQTIPVVAPYGIAFVPPAGEKSVVLNAGGESVCIGTVAKNMSLSPGEIMLFSEGGASIALKNDGYVYINGVRFDDGRNDS